MNANARKTLRIGVALGALCLATVAVAAPQWTARGRVTNVFSGYTDGSVFVAGLQKLGPCSDSLIHFTAANSDPAKILSIATAAHLSGKTLACAVSNSSCDGTYQIGYQCNIGD
jgi:hypothetical protein